MNAIEQFKKGRVIRCQNPSGPLNMRPKKKVCPEQIHQDKRLLDIWEEEL